MSILEEIKSAEAKAVEIKSTAVQQSRQMQRDASLKAKAEQEKMLSMARAESLQMIEDMQDKLRLEGQQVAEVRKRKYEAQANGAREKLPQAAAYIVGRIVK